METRVAMSAPNHTASLAFSPSGLWPGAVGQYRRSAIVGRGGVLRMRSKKRLGGSDRLWANPGGVCVNWAAAPWCRTGAATPRPVGGDGLCRAFLRVCTITAPPLRGPSEAGRPSSRPGNVAMGTLRCERRHVVKAVSQRLDVRTKLHVRARGPGCEL